jgi:hypothetical protein
MKPKPQLSFCASQANPNQRGPSQTVEVRQAAGAREEPQCLATLRFFLRNKSVQTRTRDMNPEIRALFLGLIAAALASPVILALFYSP